MTNLERVVAFAKENGFPNAASIFWNPDYAETCESAPGEGVEDMNYPVEFRLGMDLGGRITCERRWTDSSEEDEICVIEDL